MPSTCWTARATSCRGTAAPRSWRAIAPRRSSAGTSPCFYPPEAIERGWPEQELQMAQRERPLRGRGLARAQGRHPLLGQRRHHGAARRGRRAARLLEDHARPDRAPARTRRACARARSASALLVEGVKDYAIFMLDPDGRVASWNAGAERIKGYQARRDHRPPLLASSTRRTASTSRLAGAGAAAWLASTAASRTRAGGCARTARFLGQRGHHRRSTTGSGDADAASRRSPAT